MYCICRTCILDHITVPIHFPRLKRNKGLAHKLHMKCDQSGLLIHMTTICFNVNLSLSPQAKLAAVLPAQDDGVEGGDEMTEDDEGGLHTITEEEEQDEMNRSLSQSRLGTSMYILWQKCTFILYLGSVVYCL